MFRPGLQMGQAVSADDLLEVEAMMAGNWSSDDNDNDSPSLVGPEAAAAMHSNGMYLVKDHAFHWEGSDKRVKKDYQTDVAHSWNIMGSGNSSRKNEVKKSDLHKKLEKSFKMGFPLSMRSTTAMSLKRNYSEKYSDWCVAFKINPEDEFFLKLKQVVIDPVLVVELKIDAKTDSIEINLNKDDLAEAKHFRRRFTRFVNKKLKLGQSIHGSFSVLLKGKENRCGNTFYDGFNIPKKMFEEQIDTDCTVVAANKAEIKCHQFILRLHSSVFRSMFESGMQESVTQTLEMKGMPEEAANSFLKFLCYWDLSGPKSSVKIAFSLLQAAHMYVVQELEMAMVQLFGKKRLPMEYKSWCYQISTDELVEMYVFAHKVGPDFKHVELACVDMLKLRIKSLKEATQFREIFQTNPELAMDLCLAFGNQED